MGAGRLPDMVGVGAISRPAILFFYIYTHWQRHKIPFSGPVKMVLIRPLRGRIWDPPGRIWDKTTVREVAIIL